MVSVRESKKLIVRRLLAVGIDAGEAAVEAQLIHEHVGGGTLAEQMLRASDPLEESQLRQIEAVIEKRERRMPLQYALGYGWFMGRRFSVQRGVFIPRSDTESVVEVATRKIVSCGLQNAIIGRLA